MKPRLATLLRLFANDKPHIHLRNQPALLPAVGYSPYAPYI